MFILLLLYSLSSLLLALLSIPLLLGKVPPNPYYGVRISATLADPPIWFTANRYFARYQLIAGLVELCAAIALYFWPGITVDAYALACLGIFVLVFGYGLFMGWRFIKQLQTNKL